MLGYTALLLAHVVGEGPAHDSAGPEVEEHSQVAPALTLDLAVQVEVLSQQVRWDGTSWWLLNALAIGLTAGPLYFCRVTRPARRWTLRWARRMC